MRLTEPVGDLQELPMPEEELEPPTRGIMTGALALIFGGVEAGFRGLGQAGRAGSGTSLETRLRRQPGQDHTLGPDPPLAGRSMCERCGARTSA
jgi:hypothetical protein